ncbi:MAG: glycoside hydrolase family 3 N-terminal domain-containing protein [Bacteroidales bacterium]
MKNIKHLLLAVILFLSYYSFSQNINLPLKNDPERLKWVDSVFNSLTPTERIAQLIMIRSNSDQNQAYYDTIAKYISKYNIGGICFFKGGPIAQANTTNYYQKSAKTPLFISIDGEWGLNMRLDSTSSFPRQMTFGAIENDSLIYRMGEEIANQCKIMGIHINFAPVLDINSDPKNPVINSRSFGEDKWKVAKKGIIYMKGMQNNGIITTAKHFPGHGDTDSDSHHTLPVINHSKETIDTLDLYPFKELINNGITGVMVAHLFIPCYDTTTNTATSLSKNIVTNLLKKELGFNGLIFTDALEMKGVTNYFKPGLIEVKALQAGNDILLLPENITTAINSIKIAIDSNWLSKTEMDEKCKKVLEYKYLAGLNNYKPINIENLYQNVNTKTADIINYESFRQAITIILNKDKIIPLKDLEKYNIGVLSIGDSLKTDFQKSIENYTNTTNYNIPKDFTDNTLDTLLNLFHQHNLLIVAVHNTSSLASKNFGISKQTIKLIDTLSKTTNLILNFFAYPYTLSIFNGNLNASAIIVSNQDKSETQLLSAELLFGGFQSSGSLPVTISGKYPINTQIKTPKTRLGNCLPEEVKINAVSLNIIDSIANKGIKEKAYPGCQILIAKDGMIFYKKSFGTITYDSNILVKNTDLYDVASITKVAATTLAIMKLYEDGKINLDKKLSYYIKYLRHSNKKNITIRQIMSHQARLKSWIPFYKETMINGVLDSTIYSKILDIKHTIKVADSLYITKNYKEKIIQSIINSDLNEKEEYEYSDLGFYLLKELVEKITEKSFEQYLNEQFYIPLGLRYTCFNPLNSTKLENIIPTENDTIFRKQLIRGYVHDPGAAMLGGVSGHAGLFSNAGDLAIIFQLLLQHGEYGEKKLLNDSTISRFTRQQYPENNNRRALGFDRQLLQPSKNGPACISASQKSFGHSGFTGTYVWADPEQNLLYIFLSNRVNPDASNGKLSKMNIRTDIHQHIYDILNQIKN